MKFSNILDFKYNLKKRIKSVNPIKIKNINKLENSILVTGEVLSSDGNDIWRPRIKFLGPNISSNSEVLVECNCYSFLYEFSKQLYNNKALLYPERYKKLLYVRKQLNVLSACKHVILLSKEISKNLNKINNIKNK